MGRDFGTARDYSEEFAAELDKEVKKIVDERYALAKQILTDNRDLLDAIAKELLEKETLDDESREFIKRTYLTVINPYENDEKRIVFYGPENGKHLCDSTDVVLGIRYNEFETNGMSDEEFQKNFLEQLKLIAQVSTLLEIASPNELGSQVKVIQYNELSIMKK
jgi:hypothetical protein